MSEAVNDNSSHRTLENIAIFGGSFVLTQIAEFVGNQVHNPNVMSVPEGGVIGLGLVLAGVSAAVYDRIAHRHENQM
ncbi:MAG TPA: hypothetical protein VIH90_08260 [Candidatus Saccharimonadales bacterium]